MLPKRKGPNNLQVRVESVQRLGEHGEDEMVGPTLEVIKMVDMRDLV